MKDILELTKRLMAAPSFKGNGDAMKKVIAILHDEIKEYKVHDFIKNGSPSFLASNRPKSTKAFKVILNAHVDVVPGTSPLFTPKVVNGRLYGRGAYDMKAAAAVETIVFAEIGKIVSYPLALQIVTDEEVGGFDGVKHHMSEGITTEFFIAGEPTNLDINNMAKGIIWIKVQSHGTAAHGANLWQGKNAVWTMNAFLNTIKRTFPEPKKEVWKTTVNLGMMKTENITYNKVPDSCEVGLDIRYLPKDKVRLMAFLKKSLLPGMKMEVLMNESPLKTSAQSTHIHRLSETIQKQIGKKPNLIQMHFGSDARHYSENKIDAVTFGPRGYGLHTDDEWVDIKSLTDYYHILKSFLLSYEK
jgi:succinyl-diaminopimelate desuccinylase